MQIEIGQLYSNKTWSYLVPCLEEHGEVFTTKFNGTFKLAVGIFDNLLLGSEWEGQQGIYILCDRNYNKPGFEAFLDWLSLQDFFMFEYAFDDVTQGQQHMIVVRVPEKHQQAYTQFLEGKYSKMYEKEDVERYFAKRPDEKAILLKEDSAKQYCKDLVLQEYNVTLTDTDLLTMEYELPYRKNEEIFNSKYS